MNHLNVDIFKENVSRLIKAESSAIRLFTNNYIEDNPELKSYYQPTHKLSFTSIYNDAFYKFVIFIDDFYKCKYQSDMYILEYNQFFSDKHPLYKYLIKKIYNINYFAIKYASDIIKSDPELMLNAVSVNGSLLEYGSTDIKDNFDIVYVAVNQYDISYPVLQFASDRLRNNKDIVLAALACNGEAFKFASTELQDDEDIVNEALDNQGMQLEFVSERLQNIYEISLKAVSNESMALQFVPNKFKNVKELVIIAVRENGLSLEFASIDLRDDIDVVLEAVCNEGSSLIFASERLRGCHRIVDIAIQHTHIEYTSY